MADGQRKPTFGEQQRRAAAHLADLADRYERHARECREMDNDLSRAIAAESGGPGFIELAAMMEAAAYRVRTFQRISAEAARNYDAMVAAGGRRNKQAFAQYREAMEMLTKLIPTSGDDTDLGT